MQTSTPQTVQSVPTSLRAGMYYRFSVPAENTTPDIVPIFAVQSERFSTHIEGTIVEGAYQFTLTSSTTIGMPRGRYDWVVYARLHDEQLPITDGTVQVLPPADGTGLSHAERVLAALEAVIEQRAIDGDAHLLASAFGEMSATWSPAELMAMRDSYAEKVARITAGRTGNAHRPFRPVHTRLR